MSASALLEVLLVSVGYLHPELHISGLLLVASPSRPKTQLLGCRKVKEPVGLRSCCNTKILSQRDGGVQRTVQRRSHLPYQACAEPTTVLCVTRSVLYCALRHHHAGSKCLYLTIGIFY